MGVVQIFTERDSSLTSVEKDKHKRWSSICGNVDTIEKLQSLVKVGRKSVIRILGDKVRNCVESCQAIFTKYL